MVMSDWRYHEALTDHRTFLCLPIDAVKHFMTWPLYFYMGPSTRHLHYLYQQLGTEHENDNISAFVSM
jgi:hypothetical protein